MKRLFLVLAVVLFAHIGMAQNAQLAGVVKDKTGSVVPDAAVTLKNTLTGVASNTKSNKVGYYSFDGVQPGTYSIHAEHQGFTVTDVTGIILYVADDKALDVTLKVGSTSETVTVDGSALTLNTTNGAVSTVIDRTIIENMPLNGRSLETLFELTPGVVTMRAGQFATGGIFGKRTAGNGQRTACRWGERE